jgi:hypothetical protein
MNELLMMDALVRVWRGILKVVWPVVVLWFVALFSLHFLGML